MFKRDVDIAQHVAEIKLSDGYPNAFGVSYAKNTVKHLQQIIVVLADAGIMTQGVLSLQSMDQSTLDVIRPVEHQDRAVRRRSPTRCGGRNFRSWSS